MLAALLCGIVRGACAQELEEARQHFRTGKYDECLRACAKPEVEVSRNEEWPLLHAQALLAVGRYPPAEAVVSNALSRVTGSIRLRLLGVETANATGDTNLAGTRLREINQLAGTRTWAYRDPPNIVALGRTALLLGVDPKTVLERLFDPAQKADPDLRDSYLAGGELALEKHDFALAAKKFSEAQTKFPDDADILCGLARAYEPSARGKMLALLETALEKNANHVPSLLLLANHLMDAEEYAEAGKILTRALQVNPWRPEAWAFSAVLAHLRNDGPGETDSRKQALHFWSTNPLVDHLIGAKLAQNYRFQEGAAYQRRALEFDPEFLPARIELAEDLLRLGEESEGWQLAEIVHQRDGYEVTAFNLVALRGVMQKFQTLTNEDFILRMSPSEAALYGDRALGLLQRARLCLTEKYGIKLEQPTVVEIFPEQKDFGVRTFGMPHNPGFLGVCFGRVVTANSPASAGGNPANWEAVLWHEFTHVITLQLTRNRMPRWLSEGLSVYEELQANPTWGQRMNPRYRELTLGGDLKPVGELSSAFMSPKSDLHVQFAYYESALVVQFLVEKFGFEKLRGILRDLAVGTNINDALPKHTAPMKEIEKDFAAYARAKAEALAPGLDFTRPKPARALSRRAGFESDPKDLLESPAGSTNALRSARLPSLGNGATNTPAPVVKADDSAGKSAAPNYWALMDEARKLVSQKQWESAKAPLQKLVDLYPDQTGENNACVMLVSVHHGLGETNQERSVLEKWAALDNNALDAFLRLMQLGENVGDWKTVAQNADRFLAVNPLLPQPYRFLGRASEEVGDAPQAIGAYQKILLLDPPDPAEVHFRLATLQHNRNDPAAKRHTLQALEEAPRFRDAHRLLLELAPVKANGTNSSAPGDLPKSPPPRNP